jgi:integrase
MKPIPSIDTPSTLNGTVPPRRVPNRERRSREHVTPGEVELLMEAAKGRGRYGHRDATLMLLAYRHGLRVSELVALRWDQVDLAGGMLHVNRVKRGTASVHPLRGPELRALRKLEREGPTGGSYVFASERGGPMTAAGFRKMLARAGEASSIGFPVHPHMLRHGCGYNLANDGHGSCQDSCRLFIYAVSPLAKVRSPQRWG